MFELVKAEYEGWFNPWLINWFLFGAQQNHFALCVMMNWWGLLWNDNGVLMDRCLNTNANGLKVEWYTSAE
jgi:hypothetical protein